MEMYTYAQSPVALVKSDPQDPRMAMGYAVGLPGVNAAVRARAMIGYAVAKMVLGAHVSGQARSSHPEITFHRGNRTDYYIDLEVTDENPFAAAYSIEYGRRSFVDSAGTRQPSMNGVGALTEAMNAMGG